MSLNVGIRRIACALLKLKQITATLFATYIYLGGYVVWLYGFVCLSVSTITHKLWKELFQEVSTVADAINGRIW